MYHAVLHHLKSPPHRGEQNPLMWGFIPHGVGGFSSLWFTLKEWRITNAQILFLQLPKVSD